MAKEFMQKQPNTILAAVTLSKHRVSGGNAFVIEAANEEEQKQLMLDLAKGLKSDVLKTSNGIYIMISG